MHTLHITFIYPSIYIYIHIYIYIFAIDAKGGEFISDPLLRDGFADCNSDCDCDCDCGGVSYEIMLWYWDCDAIAAVRLAASEPLDYRQ